MELSTSRNIAQPGLRWDKGLFSTKPSWTTEPSIDIIKTLASKHLDLENEVPGVSFFAQGSFNKLYEIKCSKGVFIFRVTLPVAPGVKTSSEVATLAFVREHTTVPVPRVIACDPDLTNELGFEWILMERLEGRPLREKWHDLSWLKKGLIVQQVADFTAQLSRLKFPLIGSIYSHNVYQHDEHQPTSNHHYTIGEAVTPTFFIEDHIQFDHPRGPFTTSLSFVTAHMQHFQHDIATQLQSDDEDDRDDAEEMQEVYNLLHPLITQLFPPSQPQNQEFTTLFHHDLSANNILVNPAGDLIGIVDWECTLTAPSWLAYQLPEFLEGPRIPLTSPPDLLPTEYHDDADAVTAHQEQVHAYEVAQLRRFFLEEMARVEPEWVDVFREQGARRDVLVAAELVGQGRCLGMIRKWIADVARGGKRVVSLTDRLRGVDVEDEDESNQLE
ncbi:kinase-like domain-containing protein [Paraphoma chrysanthemicola]|uniref:Kinase-like domain-containing protein n=1 Tax=Paraphoma chrysanthemicola TaxID=798071 RepID=A0A8K0RKR4_9PLEO|nr:kinase-like domain-containing protein [Paraphoma chrysanthemicola]